MVRPATVTQPAQDWIEDLPPDTWFTPAAVPGPSSAVYTMLHRMLADPAPLIGRAAHGVYWRRHPVGHILHDMMPSTSVAEAVAPAGSGWASWSALAAFSWSTQRATRHIVGVPVRGLRPPAMPYAGVTPVYLYRRNRRRLELTWGEATLLDAARSFGGSDCHSWDHAMECLTRVDSRSLAGTSIDKDRVMWAAETERFRPKWPAGDGDKSFAAVIGRLRVDMPERVPVCLVPRGRRFLRR